jgi:nitrous oxide reductase accessory protein NosL
MNQGDISISTQPINFKGERMLKLLLSALIMIGLLGCSSKEPVDTPKAKKQMWMFQSAPMKEVILLQKGDEKNFCPNCGMTLAMFYKTNHAATVDGKVKQYCSIHCLAEDIMQGKAPQDIKVVDVTTLKFIPADTATYIVGSNKKGTMSPISKYAFAIQDDAGEFMVQNGGEMMGFTEALTRAKEDFSPQVREKMKAKKMMMAKKGEKIYQTQCQQGDLPTFHSVAAAKAYIIENHLCRDIKGKKLQAVGIYLLHK